MRKVTGRKAFGSFDAAIDGPSLSTRLCGDQTKLFRDHPVTHGTGIVTYTGAIYII